MTGPGAPWFVQLLVAIERSGLDWFSNPWHETGDFMATWTGDYELRRLTAGWSRTPTVGVVQDKDMCTFHFINLTGGNPDPTWTPTDYGQVESAFDAYWGNLRGLYFPETKLVEYVWRADGPAFRPHGTAFSPTLRATARSVAGNVFAEPTPIQLPPQVAISVTETTNSKYTVTGVGVPGAGPGGVTQERNRWGRFYLPAPSSVVVTDGRITSSQCNQISGWTKDFYNTCVSHQIIPVVYSPTTGRAFSVLEIHVDDLFDVIRSRRYDTPTTRAPNVIDAA